MSLRINTNTEAFNAHRQVSGVQGKLAQSMERLSSGYRINRASDDVAGLAISEKLRGQIKGLAQAQRNVGDAVSLVQTAEGVLEQVHNMLGRIRELAVQHGNGALSASDKQSIQDEVNQLGSDIERIGSQTEFNSIKLLSTSATVTFQTGAMDGQTISVAPISLASSVPANVYALSAAGTDLAEIDGAITAVSDQRAKFGAVQNRLEYANNDLATYQENLMAAESRIRDVDMAAEMAELTKLQVLQHAGTAMLAQANQLPQNVLSLLKG